MSGGLAIIHSAPSTIRIELYITNNRKTQLQFAQKLYTQAEINHLSDPRAEMW